MKAVIILICVVLIIAAAIWWGNGSIAPLFLNSRIERLGEKNLPKIMIENRSTVYCRMKADDFRFPLPLGSLATNAVVMGGFDTADGSIEARFVNGNQITASDYVNSLSGKVQAGGQVTAELIPGGLLIKFHYFGDK